MVTSARLCQVRLRYATPATQAPSGGLPHTSSAAGTRCPETARVAVGGGSAWSSRVEICDVDVTRIRSYTCTRIGPLLADLGVVVGSKSGIRYKSATTGPRSARRGAGRLYRPVPRWWDRRRRESTAHVAGTGEGLAAGRRRRWSLRGMT